MREMKIDIFNFSHSDTEASVICITTNGMRTKEGLGVMGAGVALTAKNLWPGIDLSLGRALEHRGNVPSYLGFVGQQETGQEVWSFPTKDDWRRPSDPRLIVASAKLLMYELFFARPPPKGTILIPRPGCRNGGLKWEEVRLLLQPIFSTDQIVITHL